MGILIKDLKVILITIECQFVHPGPGTVAHYILYLYRVVRRKLDIGDLGNNLVNEKSIRICQMSILIHPRFNSRVMD